MEISEKFAERLRQRREHCGLTQERLSAISGVQQELIRLLEHGQRPHPSVATMAGLASALGVSVEWLLTGAGHGQEC